MKLYEQVEKSLPMIMSWNGVILVALLLVLFIFSYKKQTIYIVKRVKANISMSNKRNKK